MFLKTPNFWRKRTIVSTLLLPISYLYYLGSIIIQLFTTKNTADIPIICVGNVTVGGAGKTPFTIALYYLLKKYGYSPAIISRGYGGTLQGPIKVDPELHSFKEVGDEPLLMAKQMPVFIAKKRYLAINLLKEHNFNVAILDDGLQNPDLKKDISLLVINGITALGNDYMFPAGPLREPLRKALQKSDAVIIIDHDRTCFAHRVNKPVIRGSIESASTQDLMRKKVVAFAGIAYPEKFFSSLESLSCNVINTKKFPDHHVYKDEELEQLIMQAKNNSALLITTEKDYMRIPEKYHKDILTLPIKISIDRENEEKIKSLLYKFNQKQITK